MIVNGKLNNTIINYDANSSSLLMLLGEKVNIILIARIGKDLSRGLGSIRKYWEDISNINDIRMWALCNENDLRIGTTFYNLERKGKYTYIAKEQHTRSFIDFYSEYGQPNIWTKKQSCIQTTNW